MNCLTRSLSKSTTTTNKTAFCVPNRMSTGLALLLVPTAAGIPLWSLWIAAIITGGILPPAHPGLVLGHAHHSLVQAQVETLQDLRKFLEYQIPNCVERIKFGNEDWTRLKAKAERFGLPFVAVPTTKTETSTTLKWLSAEFRRRVLLVEILPTEKNKGVREELLGEVGDGSKASMCVLPPGDGANVKYQGE